MTKKPSIIRTHPDLWEACKNEAIERAGKFSARAMQQAVLLYRSRGGGYIGEKSRENPLVIWSKNEENKSGN